MTLPGGSLSKMLMKQDLQTPLPSNPLPEDASANPLFPLSPAAVRALLARSEVQAA
jgi:hypothetical protein